MSGVGLDPFICEANCHTAVNHLVKAAFRRNKAVCVYDLYLGILSIGTEVDPAIPVSKQLI